MDFPRRITTKATPTTMKKPRLACDYCRLKKAKCSEEKPCLNCVRKGIPCTYNPEDNAPPSKMDRAFQSLNRKIDELSQKLDVFILNGAEISFSNTSDQTGGSSSKHSAASAEGARTFVPISADEIFTEEDLLASVVDDLVPIVTPFQFPGADNAVTSTVDELIHSHSRCQAPILGTKVKDKTLEGLFDENFDIHSDSPYRIQFYDDYHDTFDNILLNNQMSNGRPYSMDISSLVQSEFKEIMGLNLRQGANLREHSANLEGRIDVSFIPKGGLSIKADHADELFESYLEHIYPFYPIVCDITVRGIRDQVEKSGISLNTASCEYLLLLALGEVTLTSESHHYWSSVSYISDSNLSLCHGDSEESGVDNDRLQPPPGFQYFWQASGIISKLKLILKPGFDKLSIQLLVCIYYMKTCQLNNLKREVLEGSDMLFKFIETEGTKHSHRDILPRLYWVFLNLERYLYNMKLLESSSALVEVQDRVTIPRGCKSEFSFVRDADTFYSNCFMQNILLANIDDKARIMSKKLEQPSGNEDLTFNDSLRIFIKFENELNIWREILPFNFQWEDDISVRSTHLEIDLLKMKYYLCYVTVCEFIIQEYEKRKNSWVISDEISKLYIGQIQLLIEKVLQFSIKAQSIFNRQALTDLDPVICSCVLNCIFFVLSSATITKYRFKYSADFKRVLNGMACTKKKVFCFTLHSPALFYKWQKLEEAIRIL